MDAAPDAWGKRLLFEEFRQQVRPKGNEPAHTGGGRRPAKCCWSTTRLAREPCVFVNKWGSCRQGLDAACEVPEEFRYREPTAMGNGGHQAPAAGRYPPAGKGWRLSPSFDMNPMPSGVSETPLTPGGNLWDRDVRDLLDYAPEFRLMREQAIRRLRLGKFGSTNTLGGARSCAGTFGNAGAEGHRWTSAVGDARRMPLPTAVSSEASIIDLHGCCMAEAWGGMFSLLFCFDRPRHGRFIRRFF
ncbi:UNVERIFIED_ORG: hypothetical protein ABID57_003280 [Arthrobacter sp. UYEF1]